MKNYWILAFILIIGSLVAEECDDYSQRNDKGSKKGKYDLCLCAVFQNEASYLKEWIEFHKVVGVQHFYLYNNLSTDNYVEVLEPYIRRGEVELIDWPYQTDESHPWVPIQCNAYKDALSRCRKLTKWLVIIDTDEFIFPVVAKNLVEFLKDYSKYGAVCANWQMYGTSGIPFIPPGELMIELLTKKAATEYGENAFIKTIVQPRYVEDIRDPHRISLKKGYICVNSNGERINRSTTDTIVVNQIRVNHYWTRDEDFFYRVKCARRQKWREGFDGQLRRAEAINQVDDYAIFRFIPALKKAYKSSK